MGVSGHTVASEGLPLLSVTTFPRWISTAAHLSTVSPSYHPDDVAQNRSSGLSRLFGVKLSANQPVSSYDRGIFYGVLRRCDDPRTHGLGIVRVDVVDPVTILDSLESLVGTLELDSVPSNVRNLDSPGEAPRLPRDEAESSARCFLTAAQHELEAQADPDDGLSRGRDFVDVIGLHVLGCLAKPAYPWEEDCVSLAESC